MIRCDATHCSFDSSLLTFDILGGSAMADLCKFDSTLTTFDSSARTFDATTCEGVGPDPVPVVEAPQRVRSRRRYRIIEDPDKILEEVRREEKKVEKDRKQLVIVTRRAYAPNVEGALYQQLQAQVEKLEAKIDDRMERLAFLIAALDMDDEDDEEVMFL